MADERFNDDERFDDDDWCPPGACAFCDRELGLIHGD
jgi:hypothetical protein